MIGDEIDDEVSELANEDGILRNNPKIFALCN